jgi:hypothetical protein
MRDRHVGARSCHLPSHPSVRSRDIGGRVAQTISHWFRCEVDPHQVEQSFPRMADKGWLVRRETGMRATIKGRKHGRSHLRGIVRMLDQGTKMLDVAAMMSVLKLAMIELDGEHDDDDDQD